MIKHRTQKVRSKPSLTAVLSFICRLPAWWCWNDKSEGMHTEKKINSPFCLTLASLNRELLGSYQDTWSKRWHRSADSSFNDTSQLPQLNNKPSKAYVYGFSPFVSILSGVQLASSFTTVSCKSKPRHRRFLKLREMHQLGISLQKFQISGCLN